MSEVELLEAIRRDKYVPGKNLRAIARERAVHRSAFHEALLDALHPWLKSMSRGR